MNLRHILSTLPLSALCALSSCDKDSKVFSDADLSTERSTVAGRVTGLGDSGLVGVVVTAMAVDDKGATLADIPAQTSLSGKDGRYFPRTSAWVALEGHVAIAGLPDARPRGDLRPRPARDQGSSRRAPDLPLRIRRWPHLPRHIRGGGGGRTSPRPPTPAATFRLEHVAPGPVEIIGVVRGKGFWRTTDSIRSESTDTITGRQQIATWKPLSTVTGTLVNQDGTPQAGAIVSAPGRTRPRHHRHPGQLLLRRASRQGARGRERAPHHGLHRSHPDRDPTGGFRLGPSGSFL